MRDAPFVRFWMAALFEREFATGEGERIERVRTLHRRLRELNEVIMADGGLDGPQAAVAAEHERSRILAAPLPWAVGVLPARVRRAAWVLGLEREV